MYMYMYNCIYIKLLLKIADFRMSRDDHYYISNAKKISTKWTAPEVRSYLLWDGATSWVELINTPIHLGIALQEILYSQ